MVAFTFSILTTIAVLIAMAKAFAKSRDALHPAMYLGPMFIYANGYHLMSLESSGWLESLFDPSQVAQASTIMLLGIAFFFKGTLAHSVANSERKQVDTLAILPAQSKERAQLLGALLALISTSAFIYIVLSNGGVLATYGQVKGGGIAESGYISELPLLCIPAVGLLAMAWAGRGLTFLRASALIAACVCYLMHGILGARRGPTFMVMMSLLVAMHVVSRRRARVSVVIAATGLIGAVTMLLVTNRDRIYIGTDWVATAPILSPVYRGVNGTGTGDDWAYCAGVILNSDYHNRHFWGLRYLTQVCIQPIPRQLWPDKYADVGFGWLADQSAMEGMTDNEWLSAVGWIPARGAAAGLVSDLFLEFSYLGIFLCYGFGWAYGFLWKRSVTSGGVWKPLYLFAAILSIYIPTQNFNAWAYRFLIMSVPTVLVWRFYLCPSGYTTSVPQLEGAVRNA